MRKCKWYIEEIRETITKPLKENFNIPLIIGGSGFSIAPKEVFDFFDADYGIIGEAEETFKELLSKLDNGDKNISLKNVISKYRLRVVNEIVNEIEEASIRIPGISFEFVDSVFNLPIEHALSICKEVIHRKLNVKLRTMGINPGEITEELIYLMKKSCFTQIDCTPDSASELMLKMYRKNFNKNQLIESANIIKRNQKKK